MVFYRKTATSARQACILRRPFLYADFSFIRFNQAAHLNYFALPEVWQ
jgi:hypothetical protein